MTRRETVRGAARPALRDLAEALVAYARKCGADETEVSVIDGYEFNVDVRKGRIETLVEAGSRSAGLRVIKDKKTAYASSSDLDMGTLRRLVRERRAAGRARQSRRVRRAGPALDGARRTPRRSGSTIRPSPGSTPGPRSAWPATTERAALRDKRITNSYGATFASNEIRSVLVLSNGFVGEYEQTYCGLGVGLQAGDTDNRVEDSWSSSKRHFKDLETPEAIARKAVERTVRQLKPRKIADPERPGHLRADPDGLAPGLSVRLRHRDGRLSEVDLPRGQARDRGSATSASRSSTTRSCRARSARTPSIRTDCPAGGTWSSRGACSRATSATPTPPASSASSRPAAPTAAASDRPISTSSRGRAPIPPKDIIAGTKKGLLLIRTLGHGLNSVTGDISRGAFGLWIEDGAIAYPVTEVTISGNLGRILEAIEAVGTDLEFHGPVTGPTVKVAEMTVAGS